MTPLRVGFPVVASATWMGGYNYVLNLVAALARHAPAQVQPVVFFGADQPPADRAPFARLDGVALQVLDAFSAARRGAALRAAIVRGRDGAAARAFDDHRIDVVFESARFFGWRLRQGAIAWFPDFQHRRLPQLFGRGERWRRELGFRMQVAAGRRILVSSDDARRDCARYYPAAAGRIAVLRFPGMVDAADLPADADAIRRGYGLPERFAYLPNQFWRHKNHALVIEALGQLRRDGAALVVAATGNSVDPRAPEHLDGLLARARALGVADSFRVLGIVPRAHVLALLQTCAVLVNPSLCEGWNSGVEEAKLLGVPLLLSDLAVHREQAGDRATYFDAADPAALAAALRTVGAGVPRPRTIGVDPEPARRAFAAEFAAIAAQARRAAAAPRPAARAAP